ncbi:MAG TPA: [protein-PII] uridylyltransferase [Hyphomicrobiales bacterium]|nr:[protein-PII] uridylyltransferase [Hyphomicrobiales bacterium]
MDLAVSPARPAASIDAVALDASLAALADLPAEERRAATVAVLRDELARSRAAARAMLEATRQGTACAERLSADMDAVVSALYRFVTTHLHPRANPSATERLAVAAVGGYGRGTLAPGSDIDLLFLLPYKQTPWGESVVESMLYVLWDLGLKVGHATRSIDDCIRQSRGDITIRTAVLEVRGVAGDEALVAELIQRFDKEVVEGTAAEFVQAKLAERDERQRKVGGSSRYVVEPNVKDGKGGLRDLNTLFWIAKYVYRVRDPDDLVAAGLFTPEELKLFKKCEDFLWAVRCFLHFVTGRAEERLSFEVQRAIGHELGYRSHPGMQDVERFMKHYFLVAKDVGDLTAIVCAALEEREAKPRPRLDRFLHPFGRSRKKAVPDYPGFVIENARLSVADDQVFQRDPVNLIRFFHLADTLDVAMHPDAMRLITRSLHLIDARLRDDPEANRLFLEILTSRHALEVVLRRMNETGVLGRFIPDFGRIVAMMQFNMYHHYTVDEHLIRALGTLADIEAGRFAEELPLSREIMPMIENRRVLYVALLLHDIAKGRPEDHSLAGARIGRRLGPRLGLSAQETETVAWLVEYHLLMSMIAQSRDLSDRKTIEDFAAVVQTMERLKMLTLLTVADIKAVGPGVWNGWKGQLLRTLYWETEVVITGGQSSRERADRVREAQDELRAALSDWPAAEIEAYLARHYPAYWLKVDLRRRVAHARFLREAQAKGRMLATAWSIDAFAGVTELTVLAPDHPRLLSVIAGACAAAGANIADADIHTTTDGLALDTILVNRAFDDDEDERRRAQRVAELIERAVKGEVMLTDMMAERSDPKARRTRAFTVEPHVVVADDWSERHTVIEITGLDRPGLLYDLTRVVSRLNLNIASAHVATFGERAVDVFYVTDLVGHKVTNASRKAAIRRHLAAVFTGEDQEPRPARKAG